MGQQLGPLKLGHRADDHVLSLLACGLPVRVMHPNRLQLQPHGLLDGRDLLCFRDELDFYWLLRLRCLYECFGMRRSNDNGGDPYPMTVGFNLH
jgi:hypothetical protein